MTDQRTFGPGAQAVAFPLGGIGTGTVSVGARGELRDWEIANRPDKGSWLPFTFFALRIAGERLAPIARVLEGPIQPSYEGDSGYNYRQLAGLPRMQDSTFTGEYPLMRIAFSDERMPVAVELEAYSPLIPLDADDSGIPAFVWRYRVTNTGEEPVDVSVAGTLTNPIATTGRNIFHAPLYKGAPTLDYVGGEVSGLRFGTSLDPLDPDHGTAVLATAAERVTAIPRWPSNVWNDAAQHFWDEFVATGSAVAPPAELAEAISARFPLPKLATGTLCIEHTIAPGESRDFEFVFAWHTPNRVRAWGGNIGLAGTHADEIVRNHYATRFADAWDVATDMLTRRDELDAGTRAFHSAVHGSTLPVEVRDAVSSTLTSLRSTTCFRIEDPEHPEGIFAGWEGSFDHEGSCEGTCTHVWNYAQSVAQLFPELERSARRVEFLGEVEEDGKMRYRANSVFGGEPWEYHAAVDGQLGTIVRLYREYRISGDIDFLRELWPSAVRSLEYAFTHWDRDGDLVLDAEQHNTYDIEFFGENSLSNSMFIAALRAASAMARELGDEPAAARYREAAELSAARTDEMLFNGEYYVQRIADVDAHPYQYGQGCLSDQVFGQTLAHLTGLGHVLPEEHVQRALRSIVRHNFREGFAEHASIQRVYALGDESGLLLCSWPGGQRPRFPFVYSDEVWTGIEYQVATGLVYEGMTADALRIVRAVRDRYDGVRRNPWNEIECGNHYVRALASWGVLTALTGTEWDAPRGELRIAPRAEAFDERGAAEFIVTLGSAWGTMRVVRDRASLSILGGSVRLTQASVTLPDGRPLAASLPAGGSTVSAGSSLPLG